MSKNEILNYLEHAKLQDKILKEICYFFSLDYTASQTAQELNLSRQTINNYFKIIRTLLLNKQEELMHKNKEEQDKKEAFSLKYLSCNSYVNYYIQYKEKVFIIDCSSTLLPKIENLLNEQIISSLKNSKANCAKVLFNPRKENYLIMRMLKTSNTMQDFVDTRLKKFRGLNKDSLLMHLKESQFRFNYSREYLYTTLLNLLNLNTKARTF